MKHDLEFIVKTIKERGVTAYKIAEETGLTEVGINKILNGKSKTPRESTLEILHNYLFQSEDLHNNYVGKTNEITKVTNMKSNKNDKLVPFYDIDFAAGNSLTLVDNNQVTPDYYMDVPEFSGCTAFRAYSDSMEKLIKGGNILFGTKVEEWNIHLEYGQIYGIICTDGRRYLKYIKKHKEDPKDYFLLISENEFYDDFEIPKKSIRSVWLIHGWINKRT